MNSAEVVVHEVERHRGLGGRRRTSSPLGLGLLRLGRYEDPYLPLPDLFLGFEDALLAERALLEGRAAVEERETDLGRGARPLNVYVRSKRAGERVYEGLKKLFGKLRLEVNEDKSAVDLAVRRDFLGYSFWVAEGRRIKRRVARKGRRLRRMAGDTLRASARGDFPAAGRGVVMVSGDADDVRYTAPKDLSEKPETAPALARLAQVAASAEAS